MGRPKKAPTQTVPYLNTEKNEGELDVEQGESNQAKLGFDEPVQLGVNAIVVDTDKESDEVTQRAEITSDDDEHARDDILLVTNGDGTLLRAERA